MITVKHAGWLFIALISLSYWGLHVQKPSIRYTLNDDALATLPDQLIDQLKVYQFNTHGQLSHYLEAVHVRHTQQNDTHWLQMPHVILTEENKAPWELRAQEALSLHGGQEITFNQQVVMHQKKSLHGAENLIKTESITYFPKDKFATTPLKVTFEQPGQRIQSTGVKAYLAEGRVQLLSQARGTYVPQHG